MRFALFSSRTFSIGLARSSEGAVALPSGTGAGGTRSRAVGSLRRPPMRFMPAFAALVGSVAFLAVAPQPALAFDHYSFYSAPGYYWRAPVYYHHGYASPHCYPNVNYAAP